MIISRQTVTIKRSLGEDKYGESLGEKDYPVKARVINEIKKVQNQLGDEVISNLTITVKTSELKRSGVEKVMYEDQLSFMDEFGNLTERTPQNIAPARGFSSHSPFVRVYV